jgi:phospho-N-acetylmuramoyl-pentapeptide-transferase
LFLILFVELFSSFAQILWKKIFHKKLFPIAPFHHCLEYCGLKEHTIVMKMWLIQAILVIIALVVFLFYYAK